MCPTATKEISQLLSSAGGILTKINSPQNASVEPTHMLVPTHEIWLHRKQGAGISSSWSTSVERHHSGPVVSALYTRMASCAYAWEISRALFFFFFFPVLWFLLFSRKGVFNTIISFILTARKGFPWEGEGLEFNWRK